MKSLKCWVFFLILILIVFNVATLWVVYDLSLRVGSLKIEKQWAEENLSTWKESNQAMALQLKQKDDYVRELLQRLRQFQDEIEIVKLRGEKPKWQKTSKKSNVAQ